MVDLEGIPDHEKAIYSAILAKEYLRRDPTEAVMLSRGTLALILTCLVGETTENLKHEGTQVRPFDPKEASEEQFQEALVEFGISLGRWTELTVE